MTKATGGCHCGAVRYEVDGEAQHVALCHCADCRRCAGAPMVSWAAFALEQVRVTEGEPAVYASSGPEGHARRSFCAKCGTGLFYVNPEFLPGIIDVQSATFDDPQAFPAGVHIQTAEQIGWMAYAHELPKFDRYPG